MASLSPEELETWLLGLKSLLSGEAVRELANEVRRSKMNGEAFGALVASRATPPSLQDVIRPAHMATLRRCWNSERPKPRGGQPKVDLGRGNDGPRDVIRREEKGASPQSTQEEVQASRLWQSNGNVTKVSDALPRRAQASQQRSFLPPPRVAQAPPPPAEPSVVPPRAIAEEASPPRPPPGPTEEVSGGESPAAPGDVRSFLRKPGECWDKVDRPSQVPRLDLSTLHAKEGHAGRTDKLGTQLWMKPGNKPWTEAEVEGPETPREQKADRIQGFACATAEDQQRIAEFYGYRDEGFIATMHGLNTDVIRPRLYLGTMADAAYWPLLQSLCITHICNVAIEAQRAAPPYDAQGIQYMLLPWQDTVDQAHSLARQKFRQMREATRYIDESLRVTFLVKGVEKKASVLVHCVQGLNRSAAVVCAYLMEYEGVSLDRAMTEVRNKHRGCLSSRHWQDLLHKFNAELLRGI